MGDINEDPALDEMCVQTLSIPMDDTEWGTERTRVYWETMPNEFKQDLRDAYRPAYEAVRAIILAESGAA